MNSQIKKYNKSICTSGSSQELEKIRDFIDYWATEFGFNKIDANKIILAVDEACSNLIKYAFQNEPNKEICIKIETKKPNFVINISDDAPPFDLTDSPDLNMNDYFNRMKRGGLGIHIIKNVMDEIIYKPSDNKRNKNLLQLKKQLL